jgi:hypothetical protein
MSKENELVSFFRIANYSTEGMIIVGHTSELGGDEC